MSAFERRCKSVYGKPVDVKNCTDGRGRSTDDGGGGHRL